MARARAGHEAEHRQQLAIARTVDGRRAQDRDGACGGARQQQLLGALLAAA